MKIKFGKYRHFKGNEYDVFDVARHSETDETYVVYRPCYGDQETWIRPLSMFEESIEREGKTIKRFEFIGC